MIGTMMETSEAGGVREVGECVARAGKGTKLK